MTFSFLITSFLNSFAMVFASAKILDSKINYKSYKVYLVTLILTLYSFIMYQVTHSFMRIVILVQLYVICNFFVHYVNKKTLEEVTITSVFSWMLFFASELICALIILLTSKLFDYTPKLFANEIISLVVIFVFLLIVLNKYVNKLIRKLIHFIIELKIKNLIFTTLYIIILLSISLNFIFFDLSVELKVVLFLIILIGYSIMLFYMLIERKRRNEIRDQLNIMIEVTSNYEKILEEERIANHENRNQLIIIKDLIDPQNKKAIQYLQQLIEVNYQDSDNIMLKVSKIPMGGLRGLIYYKLLTMQFLNISFILNVSKEIHNEVFKTVNLESLQNYYKIIGVLLDNAIDAVKKVPLKNIVIEIYLQDEKFVVSICNEYTESIDFENLGKKNISTKGGNHGYGLQMVERLVNSDILLMNEKEVIGQIFIQRASIKIK